MEENPYNIENVRKKFKALDNELNTFIQSLREIKKIRSAVGNLPEKLKLNEIEIGSQKTELKHLISSTQNLIKDIEENHKNITSNIYEISHALSDEVKSDVSQMKNLFQKEKIFLEDTQKTWIDEISNKVKSIQGSYDELNNKVASSEHSIHTLAEKYMEELNIISSIEKSIEDIKINMSTLQLGPQLADLNSDGINERLKALIDEKMTFNYNSSWIVLILLLASVIISVSLYYLR